MGTFVGRVAIAEVPGPSAERVRQEAEANLIAGLAHLGGWERAELRGRNRAGRVDLLALDALAIDCI